MKSTRGRGNGTSVDSLIDAHDWLTEPTKISQLSLFRCCECLRSSKLSILDGFKPIICPARLHSLVKDLLRCPRELEEEEGYTYGVGYHSDPSPSITLQGCTQENDRGSSTGTHGTRQWATFQLMCSHHYRQTRCIDFVQFNLWLNIPNQCSKW